MMKMIIAAVAGLILGVGGGTGFVVMRHEPAPPVAEGEAADSTHLAEGEAGQGEQAGAAAGHEADASHDAVGSTEVVPGGDRGESAPSSYASAPTSHAPAADSHATTTVAAAMKPNGSMSAEADSMRARLSRIFAAMKPEDAAVVLEKLDDASVRTLLLNLSDRKAAAILSSMPSEKAAMVTRTMLADGRGG